MIRAVYDTNVILSGFLWAGNERRCMMKVEKGNVKLFSSREIIVEIYDVARREKLAEIIRRTKYTPEILTGKILGMSEIVDIKRRREIVIEDPDDIKFIECAIAAKAQYIVSGDSHLLKLRKYEGIKILNASDFLSGMRD